MVRPHFFAFVLALACFVLLTLVTFSVPFISTFYFLQTNESGGVRFGLWGWCLTNGTLCSPKALGIDWKPQLIFWLTQALALYPVSAGITLLAAISMIPLFCTYRDDRYYPTPAFSFFAFLAFLTSLAAFCFMIALYAIAIHRLHQDGFTATLGPAVWMSLGATVGLAIVSASSGCGLMCRGRYSRVSPYLAYNV